MKVSVIIPVYNEEKVIRGCLESLFNQTLKDVEIIVVNDGSTDKTWEILSEIRSKKSEIRKLRQGHKGAGAARNLGARNARGDILVFVDADMTFDKNFVKMLVKPIIDRKTIGTFSKEEFLANTDNIWAKCWNYNRGLPLKAMHPANYPDAQKVFRAILKSEFEKAGGFDENVGYTDDYSLYEKLGKKAIAANGAFLYHKNPDSLKDVFIQSRWMAKRRYKLWGFGYLVGLLRVSPPLSFGNAIIKSVIFRLPLFFVFKLVSDLGQFIGILEYVLYGKTSK